MDFFASLVAATLKPDLVIAEVVLTSEGFIITITRYWLIGDMVISDSETIIGL